MGTVLLLFLQFLSWLGGFTALVDSSPMIPTTKAPHSNTILHRSSGLRGSSSYVSQMRPSPSDDLPVLPLNYPEDDQTLPKETDINTQQLRRLLGKHYDPNFMSSSRPVDSLITPNGTLHYNFKDNHPRGKMPEELRELSFRLPDRHRLIRFKSQRRRQKIRQFLWAYTHCPIMYTWKDLGKRFWPRWIREGDCYSNGRSCSVPAGMTCKPQQSTTKTVLWWHCRRKRCKWIKIQYPIITTCGCAC